MRALILIPLALAAVLLAGIGTRPACAAGEACPDYHREDKPYAARVKADLKRYAASQGVPERLMYLYDQLGDCPACLGGDAEHPILPYMYIVYAPDAGVRAGGLRNVRVRGTGWSADEEYAARQGMREGYIEAYYVLLEETPCECCTAGTEDEFDDWNESEPDWTESPDWNDELDIDTSRSDAHESADELGPDPADLTDVDDKDRYPDELPVPPLELPPPVRPMTTGCTACQDLVDRYNDLAVRINEQHRIVAMAERRLAIAGIAIRFSLREIRAHDQKAQDENWAAEDRRLWQRHGDLVATSQSDQRALDAARAARTELLTQLAALRQAVTECEARCRLQDTQAPPTTDPDPLPDPASDDARAALPPYVRIASQVCPLCTEALERRNAIARDMNELVQGMIDAGINENSIEAWESMRADFETANEALSACAARCAVPIESTPTMALDGAVTTERCPPCRAFREQLDNLKAELDSIHDERNGVIRDIRRLQQRVRGLDPERNRDTIRAIETGIRRLYRRMEALDGRLAILNNRILRAEMRLTHCRATRCSDRYGYYQPDTRIPDEDGFENEWFYATEGHFFVTTSCEACAARARAINDWVLRQYEEWLTMDFLKSLSDWFNRDRSLLIANRYRYLEFLADLEAQIAELKACEGLSCPETHGATVDTAYQQEDIASEPCLDDPGTKAAADAGDPDILPEVCQDSFLERWLMDQELRGTGPYGDVGEIRYSQDIASGNPGDPFFRSSGNLPDARADLWGLQQVGAYDAIAADPRYAVTGHAVVVAIIDSGLDVHHPDLRGMIWQNPGELAGNGVDDDGNGFVDDTNGWNFLDNDGEVGDHNGHGTLVAGIVAAAPDNRIGIAGINPWARIMPIKVTNFLGRGDSNDVASAISYAVNEGARVINVSLGGPGFSGAEQAAVVDATRRGVLVVVAAGNQGGDAAAFWPAGLENVITVSAMENESRRARYSNWGSPVDIAAPGSNILSLRARNTDLMYFVEDDYPRGRNIVGDDRLLYHATGTSFAAPFVTGVASLVLSLRPELEPAAVRRMILHSATDVETPGVDSLTGFGLVDATAALSADPLYFVDAAISGVAATRRGSSTVVQVKGTADASAFDNARLLIAAGDSPRNWREVADRLASPVRDDLLAEFDASELRGSPTWTLRLIVTHVDDSRREARFELNLQ